MVGLYQSSQHSLNPIRNNAIYVHVKVIFCTAIKVLPGTSLVCKSSMSCWRGWNEVYFHCHMDWCKKRGALCYLHQFGVWKEHDVVGLCELWYVNATRIGARNVVHYTTCTNLVCGRSMMWSACVNCDILMPQGLVCVSRVMCINMVCAPIWCVEVGWCSWLVWNQLFNATSATCTSMECGSRVM
jgi:hypothetical protein